MSELEDKLNKILSSPAEMEKIMGLAKSLSGSLGTQPSGESAAASAGPVPDLGGLASTLKDLDPKIFRLMTRLIGEYTTAKNDKAALLSAIKPYLKEDRREKIDRAAEIAKLARLAKIAFSEFSGGDKVV
jgi:hypothetical protein